MFAAALGLSLLVAQSAVAFNVVKYVGAAYLVYLGIRLLLRKQESFNVEAAPSQGAQGARRALFEGIVVEMLNVKTARSQVGSFRLQPRELDNLGPLLGRGLEARQEFATVGRSGRLHLTAQHIVIPGSPFRRFREFRALRA